MNTTSDIKKSNNDIYETIKNFQSLNLYIKKDRLNKKVRTDKKFDIFDVELTPYGVRIYFNVHGVNDKRTCQIMSDRQFLILLEDESLYQKL